MIHKPQTTGNNKHKLDELLNFETKTYQSVIRHNTELPDAWFPLTPQSRFFTAQEALNYEFVDKIIESLPATPLE